MPIRTRPAASWWCTTASSKTTWQLKERLRARSATHFRSETDTEIIAHLIEEHSKEHA